MKKSFFILICLLSFTTAFAQQASGTATNVEATSNFNLSGFNLTRLHEYVKVGYFGELYGPSAKKWDDNQYNSQGQKTGDPVSMWHNFNITGKVYNNTSLFVSPRFYTIFGDRNDMRDTQDQHNVTIDDWQFGVQQTWMKTPTFGWDSRLSHRAPFSVASRNDHIDSQVELLQAMTWKPLTYISILSQTNLRYYVYDNEGKDNRYRMNQLTAINYIFNDKWRVQLFNEFDLQHRAPKDGPGQKQWNYFQKYRNYIATGVGYNVTQNLIVMPFLKALNDEDIRPETLQVGLWAFGKVF
jgi:hypothetical protein